MKTIIKYLLIAVLLSSGIVTNNTVAAQSVSVSLSVFQNALNPYGRWVNHGSYGQVWISNTQGFIPYQTGGHWAYTDYGWTWVSDYDWGWAPFHYGRWGYESGFGWYWVPDYDWAPAWVAWRDGGDYYGWAPLSPGLNISVGIGYGSQIPYDRWVFAPHRYITSPYIGRYYAPRTNNVTIIRNTTVVNNVIVKNNVHVVAGPRREDVERVNHTRVQTYTVSNSSRPGKTVVNNNTINVYRPVINKNTTVVNNNKTVVNKNSNNTTVNKNSNNTTVNKTKTTVNNNSNNTTKNNTSIKKTDNTNTKVNNNTQVKKPVPTPQQHQANHPATNPVHKPEPKPQPNPVNHNNDQEKPQPKPDNHNNDQPKPQPNPVNHNDQPRPVQHNPQPVQKPQPKPQQNPPSNKREKESGKRDKAY